MIIYRPIAPLPTGRPGFVSALAAMALTALLGPTWQVSNELSATPGVTPETAGNACPAAAGRNRP
jgi:hypothetical protein